jgi:hypothetical protein
MHHRIGSIIAHHRCALLVTAAVLLHTACQASARGDDEYWAKASLLIPIDEQWTFNFEEKLTFGDDGGRLDDHQADYCFNYAGLADWLILGFGYKQLFEKAGDDWEVENRPLLNVTVKTKRSGWAFASRSRFEYRIPEEGDEAWRYRNKVAVMPPWTFTPLRIQPYAADEIFIDLDEGDFNQQRLYCGFFIPLHENIRLELFYLWKLDEQDDGDWHDTNVLGSFVYFQF